MPHRKPPIVLTISGSDPSGGAGLEADLKTFQKHGVYGMALPTLLTVQNTQGVGAVHFLDPDFLEKQWKALFDDLRPAVIKIGALGSAAMARRVLKLLSSPAARGIPVVLDPVLGSTSGASLLEPAARPILRRLFPLCRVITPNALEFSALFNKGDGKSPEARLRQLGPLPYAVLLKGGHLEEVYGDSEAAESPDILWDGARLTRLSGPRLTGLQPRHTHGTGCVLASAIAAQLAHGTSLPAACRAAKAFVFEAIRSAPGLGQGNGPIRL